jgi:hypothetical protein
MRKTSSFNRDVLKGKTWICIMLLVAFQSFGTLLIAQAQYKIPTIKKSGDYPKVYYIDPSAATNGNGTKTSPFKAFSSAVLQDNASYLIKAGTVLNEAIVWANKDNYVGSYGLGEKPVVSMGFDFGIGSFRVTIENLHIKECGKGSNHVMEISKQQASHITVAYCKIEGVDCGKGYPQRNINGGCPNLTLYHNEVSYCKEDGMFLSSFNNYTIVSNYMHHNNMGGLNSKNSLGDGIQMEYDNYHNFYIANNYIDRSHTIWKFALIINSEGNTANGVCEWNTFIGPRPGNGGAAVRWLGGEKNKFNKNLLYTVSGIASIASYDKSANQPAPYGVRDNHMVGAGTPYGVKLNESNYHFKDQAEYKAFCVAKKIEKYGSDIDPKTFWASQPEKVNKCIPIHINGIVGNDINKTKAGHISTTITGGQGNKRYAWSNEKTTKDIKGLTAGNYTLTVTDDSACTSTKTFIVKDIINNTPNHAGAKINIIKASSGFEDQLNVLKNVLDGNLATRWSSNLSPAVAFFELDGTYTINLIKMACYKGNERVTRFKAYTSSDNRNWSLVLDASGSGNSAGLEEYLPTVSTGKHVKIEGYGNNSSHSKAWTSITEFEVWGTKLPVLQKANTAPVVSIVSRETEVVAGKTFILDGSGTFDPDNDELTYKWIVPEGVDVLCTDQNILEYHVPNVVASESMDFTLEASDGKYTSRKQLSVMALPVNQGVMKVEGAVCTDASSYLGTDFPKNLLDGNHETKWSSKGNEWVIIQMGHMYELSHIQCSFGDNETKKAYFDIYGSTDNITWNEIQYDLSSCGFSNLEHTYDVDGTYKYLKIVANGNSIDMSNSFSEVEIYAIAQAPTGIETENEQSVTVYPNPVNTEINIANLPVGFYSLAVYSIDGKIVQEQVLETYTSGEILSVDVSFLEKGNYIVNIVDENNQSVFSQKILKGFQY